MSDISGSAPDGGLAGPPAKTSTASAAGDDATKTFFQHSTAQRVNTDALMAQTLTEQYPQLQLVVAPEATCNLLAFAAAGHATATAAADGGGAIPESLSWMLYMAPARRLDGGVGALAEQLQFGKFLYRWGEDEFVLYVVSGRDGTQSYPAITNQYVLAADRLRAQALVLAAGRWSSELHGEIWVFDQGYWQKSRELYASIENASWDAVILDSAMKRSIIEDHLTFFAAREAYAALKVPWKRGVIYYGPPGNGKTISIKAMMHMLYSLSDPIPTLYVRSLTSVSRHFSFSLQPSRCPSRGADASTTSSSSTRSLSLF